MEIDMELTTIHDCIAITEDWKTEIKLPIGTKLPYQGHLPGGNIATEYQGKKVIVHPAATNIDSKLAPEKKVRITNQ